MCEKCIPLDEKIERYRFLERRITDHQTLDVIKRLPAELDEKKKANHPER